jgi:hypothetical protein
MAEKNSISLIYTITKDSLAAQQTQKGTLETKASTLTGFAGGMIALLLGAKDTIATLSPIAKILVITSTGLFLFSIFLATIVGWVRKHRSDPNPVALAENYLDKAEQAVQLQVIANLISAWKTNSKQLERNAIILRIALFFQTIAFILLGIVLVWVLL